MKNMALSYYFFVLIIIVGFPIFGTEPSQNENHQNSFSNKIGQVLTRRCMKHKDIVYLEHVLAKLEDALECKKKILPKHTDEEDNDIEERCFAFTGEVLECIEKLVNAIKPCLYPEEDYIPEFVIESFKSYTEYFCKHVRILTIEGLLDSNMSKCINRFMKHRHMNPHNSCFEKIVLTDYLREAPITKDELCKDLNEIYSCYHHKFKTHCPDAPRAWAFEGGLLNATHSPCRHSK